MSNANGKSEKFGLASLGPFSRYFIDQKYLLQRGLRIYKSNYIHNFLRDMITRPKSTPVR